MILFVLSYFLVAFGQPSWIPWLGPLAAVCGYALFFRATLEFSELKRRFLAGALWYTLVQAIQLSWMTSIEYQGLYILAIYAFICIWLGLQFGCLFFVLPRSLEAASKMSLLQIFAIASCWTLIEWMRLHILCGFSWNPIGMSLTCFAPSMQLSAVFGVLGLSFWVMVVNGLFLKFFAGPFKKLKMRSCAQACAFALFPYCFGIGHLAFHDYAASHEPARRTIDVILLQTGLLPSQKVPLPGRLKEFVSPWDQWIQILKLLKEQEKQSFDLIVLPEAALPFVSDQPVYPLELVLKILSKHLGPDVHNVMPDLIAPYAEKKMITGQEKWMVSNLFWMQAIANFFNAELIAGLDAQEKVDKKNYNAAFHLKPHQTDISRYEKRVLVPLAEYLPFNWLIPFVKSYGISEFFTHGQEAKIFNGKVLISSSICYEETFSELIREGRLKGAELFVNLSNDSWYPSSRLPQQHFDHGRLRAIENGVPLLRACNTGMTAAIDAMGRVIFQMGEKTDEHTWQSGAASLSFQIYHYPTLYTFWGDKAIVILSFIFTALFFWFSAQQRKAC